MSCRPAFAILAWLALGLAAHAGPLPGVRFDSMPVGCRIHGSYSTGAQVVDEYIGIEGGRHVMRTYEGPAGNTLIRTTLYDANGFMVRKDWADGKWETFSPYSCFSEPGRCRYTYRNGDGQTKEFVGKVTRKGGAVISAGGFAGEAAFPKTRVTPGPFNAGESFSDGSVSFRVTSYENCGLSS